MVERLTDQDSGSIRSPATDDNRRSSLPLNHPAVAQPKAFAEARPLQVVSIDHIDPADLMRLDPNQLDHDPILKALVTGYQQGAAGEGLRTQR